MNVSSPKGLNRAQWAALMGLALLHAFLTFRSTGELFIGGHLGWGGVLRSTIARHFLEHGLDTAFLPYKQLFTTTDLAKEGVVHWHHPPTINMVIAGSFALFGVSEASAMVVSATFRLLLFGVLFTYVLRRYGYAIAWFASCVFVVVPLQLEYGRLLNYETPVVLFTLLGLLILDRDREKPASWKTAGLIAACACVAGLFDWPGFIFAGFLGLEALLRRPRQWKVFATVAVSTSVVLAALVWWLQSSADGGGLWALGERRSSGVTTWALAKVTFARFSDYFGPVLVLAVIGVLSELRHRRFDPTWVVFGGGGLLYFMLFKQAAWVHVFYILVFFVPTSVAAGLGVAALRDVVENPKAKGLILAVILAAQASWTYAQYPELHGRTYTVLAPKKPSRGFPRDGWLSTTLTAQWINAHSEPDDFIAFHRSVTATFQMKYYVWRRHKYRVHRAPKNARFLIASRRMKAPEMKRLARKYAVTHMMGYLIFDLSSKGPKVESVAFHTLPTSLWHTYWVSSFYPEFELRPDPEGARKWAKKLGVPNAAQ